MPEMSIFADASFKVQFRTSQPTGEENREMRQQEYAALLKQVRDALQNGVEQAQAAGWEVVLVQDQS